MTALTTPTALLIVMLTALGLLTASPAAADDCAVPGVESASSLPTNLGPAAKGPDVDSGSGGRALEFGSSEMIFSTAETPRLQTFLDQVL